MKKKRKNNKEFSHIGSVIYSVLEGYRPELGEGIDQIWTLWDRIVGKAIADNARPEAIKGTLLLVNVTSSTWIHQLQFLKKDIIEKLNKALEKELVEDIKFKIGPL
jgi:hypothetical protein